MKEKKTLKRRDMLRQLGALGLNCTLGMPFVQALKQVRAAKNLNSNQPNFVFILTDDQAWNALGFVGKYPFLKTPNMDRLACEGVVFQNAFVTTSLCSPSRASFMSGCYAHVHGVRTLTMDDPDPSLPLLPKVLQKSGYGTAFLGKWHMKRHANPRSGFDYWLSFEGQGLYIDPQLNENGRNFKLKGYMTDILTDYAIKWLDKPRKKPFCLFLWHKAAHAPFTPAPRHEKNYGDVSIPEGENWQDTYEGKPAWLRRGLTYSARNIPWYKSEGKPIPKSIELKKWDPRNPRYLDYFRTLNAVDDSVGRIYKFLEGCGMLDNTMLIFSSDNGFLIGEHQRSGKSVMYEGSIRIPLIIRYPKLIKPRSTINNMVLNIDLAPSILDLAGAAIPTIMQGRSFVPLLQGKRVDWRDSFLYEYFQGDYAPGSVAMVGVRTKEYKYIHYPELKNDIDELYDLAKDPIEMKNRINDHDYAAVLAKMKKELHWLIKQTGYIIE